MPQVPPPTSQAAVSDLLPILVQGHGVLLLAEGEPPVVRRASANLESILGVKAEAAVGQPLATLLPPEAMEALGVLAQSHSSPGADYGSPLLHLPATPGHPGMALFAHGRAPHLVIELEPDPPQGWETPPTPTGEIGAALEEDFAVDTAEAGNVFEVARQLVGRTAELARYDRTLVFRILPDGSGEVIAESRGATILALLGMRFPASDLPPAAQRLAELNPIRLAPDITREAFPLVPGAGPGHEPGPEMPGDIDLNSALLRAPSSRHCQYLRNLGVVATLYLPLLTQGRMWGLLACHHGRPRQPDAPLRGLLSRLALRASEVIAALEHQARVEAERQVARRLAVVERLASQSDNIVRMLLAGDPGLLDLAAADGVAICAGNEVAAFGHTPGPDALVRLAEAVVASPEGLLNCPCLGTIDENAESYRQVAAGMLSVLVCAEPRVVLSAFRREVVHEVIWGDPSHPVPPEPKTKSAPHPFTSFEQWRRLVTGQCRPWEPETVVAWRSLPTWLASSIGDYEKAGRRLVRDLLNLLPQASVEEPFLRALFDVMSGSLVVSGDAGQSKVLLTNRDFRQIFGVAPDELVGHPLNEALRIIGMDDAGISVLPPGGTVETTLATAGVGERTIRVHHRPLLRLRCRGMDRQLSAWVFEDISRARRVELALQAARDQAVLASKAKSEFLAHLSHELRTPLNTIIGFSEIMRAGLFGALGSPRYQDYVKAIQASGGHILQLIGQTLDISRIETGHYVLEEEDVNLSALVQDVCLTESEQAERAGVRLMQELLARDVRLRCDERAVRQILLNLLANAFKFTPSGGMVTCRLVPQPTGAIALEVQDTGIGIPAEYLQRVLDPYVQVQRKGSGVGLGLALVRVLSELHGGQVGVTSPSGRGTTIRVVFPAWRTLPTDSTDGPPANGVAAPGCPPPSIVP